MRRTVSPLVAAALTVLACTTFGCAGPDAETSEPTGTSLDALTAGVPKRDWLVLDVANLDPSVAAKGASSAKATSGSMPASCSLGAPAGLADLSRTVSGRANGILGDVLGIVADVLSRPPTAHDDHHAVWGPLSGPESPGVYRFDAERKPDGTIAFQLSATPAGANAWRGLFRGATRVIDADHRVGDVEIDFGAMRAVNAKNAPETGAVVIHFGNVDGVVGIDMTFSGVSGSETPPTNAVYKYMRRPDGAGAFDFVAHANDPLKGPRLQHVTTVWAPSGAGKSSATQADPSAPAAASVTECWAPNAGLVFHSGGGATGGDPACCPAAPAGP